MIKSLRFIHSVTLMSVVACVMFSCGDDEDTPGGSEKDLIGTWVFGVYALENCDDESNDWTFSDECTENDCQKFVFKADGTFTEIDIDSDTTETDGTYEVDGNKVTLCGVDAFVDDANCATFSFSISGNELQLSGEPDSDTSASGCEAVITLTAE